MTVNDILTALKSLGFAGTVIGIPPLTVPEVDAAWIGANLVVEGGSVTPAQLQGALTSQLDAVRIAAIKAEADKRALEELGTADLLTMLEITDRAADAPVTGPDASLRGQLRANLAQIRLIRTTRDNAISAGTQPGDITWP